SVAGGYDINWSTSTETGNLGFNIYAVVGSTKYQMNKKLIPSKAIDSMKTENYSFYVNSQLNGFIAKFIIEDVDRFGRKQSSEPYSLNKQYGLTENESQIKKTDWADINQKYDTRQKEIALAKLTHYKENLMNNVDIHNKNYSNSQIVVNVKTTKAGIHKISYQDLDGLGLNLRGLSDENISMSYQGDLIPIDLINLNKKGKFSKYSAIQFYADTIDTLYSENNVYDLNLFTSTASPKIPQKVARPRGRDFEESYAKTITINRNLNYSFGSPIASEPWFDTRMLAYQSPLNVYFDLVAEDIVYSNIESKVTFDYWGGLDFPNDDSDHEINFSVNGLKLGEDEFDGITQRKKTIPFSTNRLSTSNEIKIEVPASNLNGIGLINLESISLTYPSQYIAKQDYLTFKMPQGNFSVKNLTEKSIQIFAKQNSAITKLTKFKVLQNNNKYVVEYSGLSGETQYFIMTENSVMVPKLSISDVESVELIPTEHLIISHKNFISAELRNYAEATRQNYRIIDVEKIYSKYSHKIASGEAIKQFIQETAFISNLKSVLLVGGDTYDYKNYLGLNAISFVPTIYRATDDLIKFSAVDALYGDTDDDNVPDVAVGRLPVRTMDELITALDKLQSYNINQSSNLSAVLAADNSESYDSYNFSTSSNILADHLTNSNWDITKAYLDNLSIEDARSILLSEMNSGVKLAIYTGHSSSNRWAFEGLFKNSDVQTLTNFDNPLGVIQWGCWNTYFVHPEEDSLGHEFMLSGSQGAAFVIGASTLTNAGLESRFANLFNIYMMNNSLSLGDVMIRAKREFHDESNALHKDILWGISLLGDPAIIL
ncbi:MAG: C25 family cysteine peptidase, partial [Marinicellaceae bacterium]